ncbi:hypothetical protein CHUAL_007881 [Chamberlinius hualienensis]
MVDFGRATGCYRIITLNEKSFTGSGSVTLYAWGNNYIMWQSVCLFRVSKPVLRVSNYIKTWSISVFTFSDTTVCWSKFTPRKKRSKVR